MKYFVFVLDGKLIITNGNKNIPTNVVKNNDVAILYYNDEIIGYNIFNVDTSIYQKGLVVKENNELVNFINLKLERKINVDFGDLFIVGKILECENHPDSDHLHICKVDVKDEILQIVCGAKNVVTGQKVVVAKIGAMMFDGSNILPGVLRNVKSYGMICSGYELNLDGYVKGQGILVLDDSFNLGEKFFK